MIVNKIPIYLRSLIALIFSLAICGQTLAAKVDGANVQSNNPSTAYSQVELYGVTVYQAQQLWEFALAHAHLSGKRVSPEELRASIKQIYREDGYFLADVEFRQAGNALHVFVHEGRISKIEVSGVSKEVATAIGNYVKSAIGDGPVKLESFERGIMLAKDMAGVFLTTEFDVSDHSGNDVLKISANQVKQRGSFSIDNLPRNFGTGMWATFSQEVYSVLNAGDLVRVNVLPSSDFDNQWQGLFGSVNYRTPLNSDGLYMEVSAGNGLTRNNYYGPYNQNPSNLFQNTLLANAVIGYPLSRDSHGFVYTLSEVNYYKLDVSGTGVQSIDQGQDISTGTFRQSLTFSKNDGQGSVYRGSLTATAGSTGVQYFGSQALNSSQFFDLRAGGGVTAPLDKFSPGLGIRLEGMGQFTNNSLPNVEKYFLGDYSRLRGYGYAEVLGDTGANATVELSQYFHIGHSYLGSISPFIFVDAGWLKQNTQIPGYYNQMTLVSTGVGLQTFSKEKFSVRSWLGVPLMAGYTTPQYSPAFWLQLTQGW